MPAMAALPALKMNGRVGREVIDLEMNAQTKLKADVSMPFSRAVWRFMLVLLWVVWTAFSKMMFAECYFSAESWSMPRTPFWFICAKRTGKFPSAPPQWSLWPNSWRSGSWLNSCTPALHSVYKFCQLFSFSSSWSHFLCYSVRHPRKLSTYRLCGRSFRFPCPPFCTPSITT